MRTDTGEVKSRRVCFHLSGEARGKSNRMFLPPALQLRRDPAPRVLGNVLHPSSLGTELYHRQMLKVLLQFFSYPLGNLPMNPGDSQMRFSFPPFFEESAPDASVKHAYVYACRRQCAWALALCRR